MSEQDFKGTVNGVTINSTTIGPFTKTAVGEVTNPTQPAFLALNSATDSDVVGDTGVYFTVIFDTEVYDQNSDFDGTSTFTAPVTGRYHFDVCITLLQLGANHNSQRIELVTGNRPYTLALDEFGAGANPFTGRTLKGSVDVDMDAGDTAVVRVRVDGGTRVVDVLGNAAPYTMFSGHLVC